MPRNSVTVASVPAGPPDTCSCFPVSTVQAGSTTGILFFLTEEKRPLTAFLNKQ